MVPSIVPTPSTQGRLPSEVWVPASAGLPWTTLYKDELGQCCRGPAECTQSHRQHFRIRTMASSAGRPEHPCEKAEAFGFAIKLWVLPHLPCCRWGSGSNRTEIAFQLSKGDQAPATRPHEAPPWIAGVQARAVWTDPSGTLAWDTFFVPLRSVRASGTSVFSGFRSLWSNFGLKCIFGSAATGPPSSGPLRRLASRRRAGPCV